MPKCAEPSCARWRPERLTPAWAVGIRLNGRWYCGRACVQQAARGDLDGREADASGPTNPALPLGAWLRRFDWISDGELTAALESQRRSGRRLGDELIRRGRISRDRLLRALGAQANVPYLTSFDPRRLAPGPAWLPRQTARALGLVPLDVDRGRRIVRVICAAPVPRVAVSALQKLTGWTPEVALVHDDEWAAALRQYRSESDGGEAPIVTVPGMDDVAALVADTASTDRAVFMRHARWERDTWVQVEGSTQVANVLVPGMMEGTCQVGPTPR